MKQVSTIGLDLAKKVFQVHGVDGAGTVTVRRTLRRSQGSGVLCQAAALRGRHGSLRHGALPGARADQARPRRAPDPVGWLPGATLVVAPERRPYAKAYVRRGKNDAADAAAICEAVSRPSMRFGAVKTEAQQAAAGLHKLRALLIKQRTMVINQLRGLMAEFGIVVAKGPRSRRRAGGGFGRSSGRAHPGAAGRCPGADGGAAGATSSGGSRRSRSRSSTGVAATRPSGI